MYNFERFAVAEGNERLGRQRRAVPHELLDWYANWVNEQSYLGRTALFASLSILTLFSSKLYSRRARSTNEKLDRIRCFFVIDVKLPETTLKKL